MHILKSLGIDGILTYACKKVWHIIGDSIIQAYL